MKKDKLLTLCLAFVLLLSISLAGCSGSKTESSGSAEDSQSLEQEENSETAQTDEDSAGADSLEPLDVSVTTIDWGRPHEDTPIEIEWEKMMNEKMGREINFTWNCYTITDYEEKVKTVVSSGEITDILTYFNNPTDAVNYGQKGMFVDLAQYPDLIPNYTKALEGDNNSEAKCYSDGSLYAFYNGIYSDAKVMHLMGYNGTLYNGRIFEENNLEFPTTLDGVYEAAKTLKNNGVSDYPIILNQKGMIPDNTVMAAYHTNTNRFWNGEKYEYGPLSEDYRDALQWMHKIYTEGLISPDYFAQSEESGAAAISNGTACIILCCYETFSGVYSAKDQYPEDKWTMSAIPASDKYPDDLWQFATFYNEGWTLSTSHSFVVSAKSPNVEALIQLGDLQYDPDVISLFNWGREGIDYTVDESGEKTTVYDLQDPDSAEAFASTGNPLSGSCRAGFFPQMTDITPFLELSIIPGPFVYDGEVSDSIKYTDYASQYANEKTMAAIDTDPQVALSASELETYSNIMSPIVTYEEEQRAAFIKGDRSLDEFNDYVEELKAMGDIEAAMDLYNSKLE